MFGTKNKRTCEYGIWRGSTLKFHQQRTDFINERNGCFGEEEIPYNIQTDLQAELNGYLY